MKLSAVRITLITLALAVGLALPAHAAPPKPSGSTPIGTKPLAQFGSALGEDVNSLSTFTLASKRYVVVSGDISGYQDASGVSHAASQLFIIDANSGAYMTGATGIAGGYVHTTYSRTTSGTTATIYVGGNFTEIAGQARKGIAA